MKICKPELVTVCRKVRLVEFCSYFI